MDPSGSDQAFVAEGEMDHGSMKTETANDHMHDGERDVLAAVGGIDAYVGRADEEQPLLGDGQEPAGDGGHEWSGMQDFAGLPWWRKPTIWWLLVPYAFMTLAFGGILTPRINLILNLICKEYLQEQQDTSPGFTKLPVVFNGNNPQCRIPEVQSRVAQFTLYGNLIAGLLSAIISPKLGALSDRYGRTKLICITSVGTLFSEVFTILAARLPETFPVNWILVGYALDGLCGSFTTAFAIAHAYATDCTPPATRNIAFAYFHGVLFTGLAVGPILAGTIVKVTGSNLSIFYIALCVHFGFILVVLLAVPESLSKSRQMKARQQHKEDSELAGPRNDWIDSLRAINILEPLKILWPRGDGTSLALRRNLVLLAAVDTILFGVAMGSMTVIIIYANYQFGWGTFESSIFMSIVNTFRVLCLVVLLPIVTRLVRGRPDPARLQRNSGSDLFDLVVIRVAVFFDTLGYLGYTLARTGPLMIVSGVVASIGGIGSPTLQSALTKHVPPDRTGQLLGASGLLHALARVVAPTVFNAIYGKTVGKFTQTVFVCLTCTFGAAFVLSFFVRPGVYLEDSGPVPPVPEGEDDLIDIGSQST